MMNLQEFIEKMQKNQSCFLEYIENEYQEEENYENLVNNIKDQGIAADKYEMKLFLYMLNQVSNNHYRYPHFYDKIEKILKNYSDEIKKHYSNYELFKIFKDNKRVLLFLMEEKMMNIDKIILEELNNFKYKKRFYIEYFSPEIRHFIKKFKQENQGEDCLRKFVEIYKKTRKITKDEFQDFNQKRKKGENDNFICQMIQQDSIEDFITYVNKENYPLNSLISKSIFETNPVLLKTDVTLIEYATFFGSVQIFKYLYKNCVKLTNSLWVFSVHGKDEEIIHILEEKEVQLNNKYTNSNLIKIYDENDNTDSEGYQTDSEDESTMPNISFFGHNSRFNITKMLNQDYYIDIKDPSYENCFIECIRCHHNDMANYFVQNYIKEQDYDNVVSFYGLLFYNFLYFPNMKKDQLLFYLCQYDYYKIVEILLSTNKFDIESIAAI